MEELVQQIQREYEISEQAAMRLFDQIFACYDTPDNSLLAVEKSEYYLPLASSHPFERKWIAMYPTAVVIVGETQSGTRVLLRIAELPLLPLN